MTERELDHYQDLHDWKEARPSSRSPWRKGSETIIKITTTPKAEKEDHQLLGRKDQVSTSRDSVLGTTHWTWPPTSGFSSLTLLSLRSGEPDSGAHLADMSQLQHAEEDSLVSGDLQTCPSYNMLRKTHLSVETYRHVPATTCWGRLTGQWRPTDMSQLQHAEEDSLVSGDLQTCPSYNMLRKTHLSLETYRHVPATCWGRLTCQWRPTDMSQLQHAEEDSLVTGDLQTCPSYMLRKTHLSLETYRHVPATTCWGRLTCHWRPTDMSQLHVEEDSLVTGDLQTCPSYNMLRKTHLSLETYRHVPATCWGRLTGQWRPTDMSQLQHVEEDLFTTGNYVKQNVHTQSPSTYFRSGSPFNIALRRIKSHTFRGYAGTVDYSVWFINISL